MSAVAALDALATALYDPSMTNPPEQPATHEDRVTDLLVKILEQDTRSANYLGAMLAIVIIGLIIGATAALVLYATR